MPVSGIGSVEAVMFLPGFGPNPLTPFLCIFLGKELIATVDVQTKRFNLTDQSKACREMASFIAIESFVAQVADELIFPEGSLEAQFFAALKGAYGLQKMLDIWAPIALISDLDVPIKDNIVELFKGNGIKSALSLSDMELIKLSKISLLPIGSEISDSSQKWITEINNRAKQTIGFTLISVVDKLLEPSRI